MGAYKAAIVTQGGQNLIAQALAGDKTLAFTSAKTSEHIYPVGTNITALTGLQDIMQSAQISSSKVLNDTAVQVSVRFDNDGVTQQYRINTIGVYAQPEEGQEILFAVIQAVTPDEMPVQSEVSPSAFIYNIQFAVRNASQITLLVNPAGVATLQDILDVRQEIIDIEIPEFEDYSSEGVKVPDAREAIANIKSKTKLKVILSNVKAALMGLVTLGEMRGLLVNHGLCTEPGKFFLDAAYGKYLTDQITQLNSDMGTYYSLAEAIVIPIGADLNDYYEFGNYVSMTGDITDTLLNCPYKGCGFMLHVERVTSSASNRNFAKQRIILHHSESIEYWRVKSGGTWRKWYQVKGTLV